MSLPQTWNLFRHLIDSTQSKTHQKQIMTKLIDASEASPQKLLQTLRGLHFPAYPPGDHPLYRLLQRPPPQNHQRGKTPGPDGVHNKALRNLDSPSITALTDYFNECWVRGALPTPSKGG
ncbi:hypothetical protein HPB49_008389 [Dermacentor silvarum]|uniref:Uncharacterized protein n=1 Tax=Dermacentor silvarum TaxID=543639 RepID=A0ACB8DBT1_DERSI|nr:hypothetical protein HPB49_008389 [Dermacentor silvarum]